MTKKLNVLVACEFTGAVRDAFNKLGHNAISCDLLPTEKPGAHYQGDIMNLLTPEYLKSIDILIAHIPCTYLTKAQMHLCNKDTERMKKTLIAFEFFKMIWALPIDKLVIENPAGFICSHFRRPDQYIDPFMFGHVEKKHTGLWLRGLPLLVPTKIIPKEERKDFVSNLSKKDRGKNRSRTFLGIAQAMALQWGGKT